jgi:16S rRNA G966 N2-methylase RsmD
MMVRWLRDKKIFPDASVDLVYLDPPFNSNADYKVLFREACLRVWRVLSGGEKSVVCQAGLRTPNILQKTACIGTCI